MLEIGKTYPGYHKGEVFEFTVKDKNDDDTYWVEFEDETEGDYSGKEIEGWINGYHEYLK
ncbi:hypothetical protein ACI2LM_13405 [Paenibacillus lautus]|uniref:hypothetical protein n=1 Tax=Paenibacillus lautus TaxID=1401 RepID=UPI00384B19D1